MSILSKEYTISPKLVSKIVESLVYERELRCTINELKDNNQWDCLLKDYYTYYKSYWYADYLIYRLSQ